MYTYIYIYIYIHIYIYIYMYTERERYRLHSFSSELSVRGGQGYCLGERCLDTLRFEEAKTMRNVIRGMGLLIRKLEETASLVSLICSGFPSALATSILTVCTYFSPTDR